MRKLYQWIVVGFTAFVIGVSAVSIVPRLSPPQTEGVLFVSPVYRAETGLARFMPTWRGCGGGYSQGYVTDNDEPLTEGVRWHSSRRVIRREFEKLVRDAQHVVERVPKFQDHLGKVGQRIVIVNNPTEDGKESVSILFYDGDDSYRFIDAPTLGLALEFEQHLISIDFKSPM